MLNILMSNTKHFEIIAAYLFHSSSVSFVFNSVSEYKIQQETAI